MSDDLTQKIIGAAIEVPRVPGPGLLESIDEAALGHELSLRGVGFQRQVAVDVIDKGLRIQGQRIDMLVANEAVIELKSVSKPPDVAMSQTLSYPNATGLKHALLISYREQLLKDGIKRGSL
jgi:GxxExxY protein